MLSGIFSNIPQEILVPGFVKTDMPIKPYIEPG